MATNCCATLYEEGQGRHGDVKEAFLFSHSRRRNPKDPCYKERCWVAFSINEGTRLCSRSLKGNFSRHRTEGMPSIFAWKRSSPRKRAPPTPRFTATTVEKEKFNEKVVIAEIRET